MATTRHVTRGETTEAFVSGRVLSMLVSDQGEVCILRHQHTITGEAWTLVVLEADIAVPAGGSIFSAAITRAERIADGLEPCPPAVQ